MDIGVFEAGVIAGVGITLVVVWKVMDSVFVKRLNGKNGKSNGKSSTPSESPSNGSLPVMGQNVYETKRIAIALKEQGIVDTKNMESMCKAQDTTNEHLEEIVDLLKEERLTRRRTS